LKHRFKQHEGKSNMINLNEVGAAPQRDAASNWQVRFGIYLPSITFNKGNNLVDSPIYSW
jgi:hypothetical protein